MRVSTNLSLNIWDILTDPYNHTQLAANWQAIDDHDHTAGHGKRIVTGSITDGAVTDVKLASNSVTTAKILDGTILGADLATGAVGANQLDPALFDNLLPLGSVISWYRPNGTFAVPFGFVLCQGQTLLQSAHDWAGAGSITIPDLTDRFVIGAGGAVSERTSGGANSRTWSHSHLVPDHTHNGSSHTHVVPDHRHTVGAHSHTISDDTHSHTFIGGHVMHQRPYEISDGVGRRYEGAYVQDFNMFGTDEPAPMDADTHNHTGNTGDSAPLTGFSGAITTSAPSSGVTSGVNGSRTTDSASLGGDTRPAYYGLLYIMKVRKRTAP